MFSRGSLIISCITLTIPQSIWSEADLYAHDQWVIITYIRTFIAKFPYIIVVMVVFVLAPYDRSLAVAPRMNEEEEITIIWELSWYIFCDN